MNIEHFDWIRTNGAVDYLDVFYRKGIFPNRPNMCMFNANKHVLAQNLRSCFGFLTLHKSTRLAEKILKGETTNEL